LEPAPAGPPIAGVHRLVVPLAYSGPARSLVLALKVDGRRDAARPLVAALAAQIGRSGLGAEAITWVPARRGDLRKRGFDHAGVLAHSLGRILALPVIGLLEWEIEAADQTGLSGAERSRNLAEAFRAPEAPQRIAVVDDVLTTGATLRACSVALRRAGAGEVEGLVACRA
jgi:predicted amidophosphoribosyltransferase